MTRSRRNSLLLIIALVGFAGGMNNVGAVTAVATPAAAAAVVEKGLAGCEFVCGMEYIGCMIILGERFGDCSEYHEECMLECWEEGHPMFP